jgi:hypothetical protein
MSGGGGSAIVGDPDFPKINFDLPTWTIKKFKEIALQFEIDVTSCKKKEEYRAVLKQAQQNQNCSKETNSSDLPETSTSNDATTVPPSGSGRTAPESEPSAATNSGPNVTRKVTLKVSVVRAVQERLDTFASPSNSETTALNFLCLRALPPTFYDRNDDDEAKITFAANRAINALMGEPQIPGDQDVINRTLQVEKVGDTYICDHEDFPEHDVTVELETGDHPEDDRPRILWLRYPTYDTWAHYCYVYLYTLFGYLNGPPFTRDERIEFSLDQNASKMIQDVDRGIRSLVSGGGVEKVTKKYNAYYLLNAQGEVVFLNAALLKRCPLKADIEDKSNGSSTYHEPLYVCAHQQGGPKRERRPMPVSWRKLPYNWYTPKIIRIMFLAFLWHFSSTPFNEIGVSSLFRESLCTFHATYPSDHLSNAWGDSAVIYSTKSIICMVLFIMSMYLVVRLRAKFCLFNMMWFAHKRFYFSTFSHSRRGLLQAPSPDDSKGLEFTVKMPTRPWTWKALKEYTQQYIKQLDEGSCNEPMRLKLKERSEAMMQIIYEDEGVSRLFVYRWLTTMNCQEEYEMWSNTLRSALGVFSVSNQNDPDIVLADNIVTGRNTVLSASFLQQEVYNRHSVFRITVPGQVTVGRELMTYMFYPFYMMNGSIYWVQLCAGLFFGFWYTTWLPMILPEECDHSHDGSQTLSIWNSVLLFWWANTFSALVVDLGDTDVQDWGKAWFWPKSLSTIPPWAVAMLLAILFC